MEALGSISSSSRRELMSGMNENVGLETKDDLMIREGIIILLNINS